ncbi:dihydrolipoyl dehydrogenase [Spiribacter insolitus]|uniref:Dihydrolipoyl dehydrogenase n=1 Tax=Spiribacter insolitus TaxID=3122417 RepID=A0ABV3T8A7_9GAMM
MSQAKEVRVPDIGDFDAVEIIEVLVSPGDTVEAENSLITLESDKATMEVPAPFDGQIESLSVSVGDKVSEGDVIAMAVPAGGEAADSAEGADGSETDTPASESQSAVDGGGGTPAPAPAPANSEAPADADCDVLVIGAGPGGYSAAFRAADLGLKTIMVERYPSLGGVCLNVGCIPSKALLHAAKVIDDAEFFADNGIEFGKPKIDLKKLEAWKSSVVGKLTGGLEGLAKQRKVEVVTGPAHFVDDHHVKVETADGERPISFRNVIIAAGSRPIAPPGFDLDHPRVMDSTDALKLEEVPKRMLVVGGGIIGLEMASVYHALGSEITVVELADRLMTGADPDIVKPFRKIIDKRYANIFLKTRVSALAPDESGVTVHFEGGKAPAEDRFDRVLVSVGRRPNTDLLNLEATGVRLLDNGCIAADEQMRSSVSHIFAIGDLIGQPMLAHKAVHEGKVAAEVAAGEKSAFDARVIPSVAYTDPEVAWVGVTQEQAKAEGLDVEVGSFPWAANGRSLSLGRDEGITKLIFEKGTERIVGAGIVGPNAGDLIAEAGLAIEMGADMHDIGLTIHPHPTLSETVGMAAEAAAGTLTDLYIPKKKR